MIGLFDSGLGGLTILRELNRRLPHQKYLYLGDNAAAPYGDKSPAEITHRTKLGVEFLFQKGCPLVILACNTASAHALRELQHDFLPAHYPDHRLLGIIAPTVEFVTGADWRHTHPITSPLSSETLTIGILATPGTVASAAYPREIHRRNQSLTVIQQPCPRLAALIESNASVKELESETVKCLKELESRIGTAYHAILLGCTHYDLIHDIFQAHISPPTKLYRQPPLVAQSLAAYLIRHNLPEHEDDPANIFFTTGIPNKINHPATRFFGQEVEFESVQIA